MARTKSKGGGIGSSKKKTRAPIKAAAAASASKVKIKSKRSASQPNNPNQNKKRKGGGDQSSFGPLRFPEQGKRKTAGLGIFRNNNDSNGVNARRSNYEVSYRIPMAQEKPQPQQRKRDKFQLRLPASTQERHLPYKDMAWYETFDDYSEYSASTASNMNDSESRDDPTSDRPSNRAAGKSSHHCLPTHFLSQDALCQLSRELHAFAGYVRLRPLEHEARQFMIQSLTNLAGSTFAGRDVHLQVFGSYATPEVCTYSSDVDMALWGVVPAPQLSNLVDQEESSEADDDDEESDVESDDHPQHQHREQRTHIVADTKEEKVQKWRNLLQELADQQQKLEDEEVADEQEGPRLGQDVTDKSDTAKRQTKEIDRLNSEVEVPFFVLDTVGDVDEDENDDAVDEQANVEIVDLVDSEEEKEIGTAVVSDSTRDDGFVDLVDLEEEEHGRVPYAHNDCDSDADSADKLERMLHKRCRKNGQQVQIDAGGKSDSLVDDEHRMSKRRRTNNHGDDSGTGFEVSFHSQVSKAGVTPPMTVGPVGATRTLVVRALQVLKNGLHKNRMFSSIGIRRFARVPIVTMESRLGFEGDVAIGGHNGTDTSQFAATLVKQYKSFAPVVLFLKILLNQQGLDKPFTGGLGSYKLYVMVCHHLERHMSLGGSDEPGEVLASFFYRFGRHTSATKSHKVSKHCISTLTKDSEIDCRDGLADLKPCHNLTHCVELFSICWQRLSRRLSSKDSGCSFLVDLIRPTSIQTQRQDSLQSASNLSKYREERNPTSSSSSYASIRPATNRGPSVSVGQKIAQIFSSKRPSATNQKRSTPRLPMMPKSKPSTTAPPNVVDLTVQVDASEEELLCGYGVRRSIHGALIPRVRPDVEQKRAGRNNNALAELFGRVSKNRKNKKKQSRDRNLQAIAQEVMR